MALALMIMVSACGRPPWFGLVASLEKPQPRNTLQNVSLSQSGPITAAHRSRPICGKVHAMSRVEMGLPAIVPLILPQFAERLDSQNVVQSASRAKR